VASNVSDILKSERPIEEVALFYRWLSKVMKDVVPSDLGRLSLFLIVSDLCERCPDLKNGEFWFDFATDVIGQGTRFPE
jgi:hypothetical protein